MGSSDAAVTGKGYYWENEHFRMGKCHSHWHLNNYNELWTELVSRDIQSVLSLLKLMLEARDRSISVGILPVLHIITFKLHSLLTAVAGKVSELHSKHNPKATWRPLNQSQRCSFQVLLFPKTVIFHQFITVNKICLLSSEICKPKCSFLHTD